MVTVEIQKCLDLIMGSKSFQADDASDMQAGGSDTSTIILRCRVIKLVNAVFSQGEWSLERTAAYEEKNNYLSLPIYFS